MMAAQQKNILVFFVGTRGDIMPGIAISRALMARGHKVKMAVCPGVQDCVAAYGVPCVAVGKTPFQWKDDLARMSEEEVRIMRRSMDPKQWAEVENRHGLAWNLEDCLPDSTRDVIRLVDGEGIDVLVGNACAISVCGRIALAREHLTYVRTTFSPGVFAPATSAFPPGGYEMSSVGFVNKLKHLHYVFACLVPALGASKCQKAEQERMLAVSEQEGIDKRAGMADFFMALEKYPSLGLWSESMVPRPGDYPANFEVTGHVFTPRLDSWQPSAALEAFVAQWDAMGRAPIVITFGSMMGTAQVEEAMTKAARAMGMNVVLCRCQKRQGEAETSNFNFSKASAGQATEEGVFEVDYVPHDWLMPRVSVSVSHGGAGTIQRSLWGGAPCVVCPMITPLIADQTFHAQLLERAGWGAWLEPLAPSAEQCEAALKKALDCTPACAELAAKMQGEDGAAKAAAAIERLALDGDDEGASESDATTPCGASFFACCSGRPALDE